MEMSRYQQVSSNMDSEDQTLTITLSKTTVSLRYHKDVKDKHMTWFCCFYLTKKIISTRLEDNQQYI